MEELRLIFPRIPESNLIENYFRNSRDAGWYSNYGPCYNLLQERLIQRINHGSVVILSNATIALEIVLATVKRKRRYSKNCKFVVTPSYTFPATTTSICKAGFAPLYVDVDIDDWHASVESINIEIQNKEEEIACLLLCSTFGTTPSKAKLLAWRRVADELGVELFIDCAAGFGSEFNPLENELAVADATIYSMHATKPFGVGEGGIIVGDEKLIDECKKISNFDFDESRSFSEYGTNGKISEILCATGLAVLDTYDETLIERRFLFDKYFYELQKYGVLKFQKGKEKCTWQSLFLQVDDKTTHSQITQILSVKRIQFRTDWSRPTHTMIQTQQKPDLQNTDRLAEHCLSLPLWPTMRSDQIDQVITAVTSVFE